MARSAIAVTRPTANNRAAVIDRKAALRLDIGTRVSVPFTFSQTAFTVVFRYKQRTPIPGTVGTARQTLMDQKGGFGMGRQDANDFQMYAYLNCPNDFSPAPRRVRFGNFIPLGAKTNGSSSDGFNSNWHMRAYNVYVQSGSAKADEFEDGAKLGATHTVSYTGDAGTPGGNFQLGDCFNIPTDIFSDQSTDTIVSDFQIYNGFNLTATEIANLARNLPINSLPSLWWKLDEGAGTVANDASGNGNNGTITSGTFLADTPSIVRPIFGGNLVKNGDFEYVPPFSAVQTATNWMDGTAAGSASNDLFGVWVRAQAGSIAARFDPTVCRNGRASLKLSTSDSSGIVRASFQDAASGATYGGTRKYLIPVLPNTSYTLTGYVKTNNVATSGAYIQCIEVQGDGSTVNATNISNKLTGTNDFSLCTVTFTTAATSRYAWIWMLNGVAGNISDAWFDDIVLNKTTPDTRPTA